MKINGDLIIDGANRKLSETVPPTITTGKTFKTGRKIDGKDEYCVRVKLGTMPNKAETDITIPIALKNKLLTRPAFIWELSTTEQSTRGQEQTISWFISGTNGDMLHVKTTSDHSRFTGYIELYYIDR